MVLVGDLELAVIDTASSVALPQVTHEDKHYVVAESLSLGTNFKYMYM